MYIRHILTISFATAEKCALEFSGRAVSATAHCCMKHHKPWALSREIGIRRIQLPKTYELDFQPFPQKNALIFVAFLTKP